MKLLYFSPPAYVFFLQFPEIEEAAVSFTIKEESPDEALWISDSAGQVGELKNKEYFV